MNLLFPQTELSIFSEIEESLIDKIVEFLDGKYSALSTLILNQKSDLELLASVVQRSPGLTRDLKIFGENRSRETLIKKISGNGIDQVVNLPTRVILGYGFTISNLHFWGFLVKLTYKFSELTPLKSQVEEAYSDVLFTLMAEELYKSQLSRMTTDDHISKFIANELIQLWENRFKYQTELFAPFIRELWEARQKIVPVLGTLAGVMELMRLNFLLSPLWNDFLHWYFTTSNAQGESLEEFLFDLRSEEIRLLRNYMKENQISAVDRIKGTEIIVKLLNESPQMLRDRKDRYNKPQALQLYQSFLRRRNDGILRQQKNEKGPTQTLEEYFLKFLILNKKI
jgi:hypothetical protein